MLLRLVKQDAMKTIFDVWIEMRITVHVDDKSYNVQGEKAEEVRQAEKKVHEELKEQMDMRSSKLSSDDEGKKGTVSCHARVDA